MSRDSWGFVDYVGDVFLCEFVVVFFFFFLQRRYLLFNTLGFRDLGFHDDDDDEW